MKRLLEWRPAKNLPPSKGMSSLRQYQKFGMEWLYFLFENGLGGLLCDEMGLGKTHQVMALIVGLLEHGKEKGPFLAFAKLCVRRHIITILKSANNNRHKILNASISIDQTVSDDGDDGPMNIGNFLPNGDSGNHK